MTEYIDDALNRLANGVNLNDRLTLESILRTGLPYMDDVQIERTRRLCAEALVSHNAMVPAYVTTQRQMHPARAGNVGEGNGSYHAPTQVQQGPKLPGEEKFAA